MGFRTGLVTAAVRPGVGAWVVIACVFWAWAVAELVTVMVRVRNRGREVRRKLRGRDEDGPRRRGG
jgi:hypothetical protein